MALSFTGSYLASYGLFTPNFTEPPIPTVATELKGHFLQHKWDENVSHIASGYWYNSASNAKVRIDETYDTAHGTSVFDYSDTNPDGGVMNHQIIVSPSVTGNTSCYNDYVQAPGFPLVTANFSQSVNATFGGVVQDSFLGTAQTWNFLYGGVIPVIVYLDSSAVLLGYDFWGAERRTKVVTRFFAQQSGGIDQAVFANFTCPTGQ